jgi:anti-sigma regulatory factor (Ser/Thr protein kinase)
MPAQRSFPPEIASGHRAQEFVAQLLGGHAFDTIAARIVTSELVTNAVEHAGSDVTVAVSEAPDHVRIDVTDADFNHELHPRSPGIESESGRGLLMVDELSTDWGVEPHRSGKTVWAVLERPALVTGEGSPRRRHR